MTGKERHPEDAKLILFPRSAMTGTFGACAMEVLHSPALISPAAFPPSKGCSLSAIPHALCFQRACIAVLLV